MAFDPASHVIDPKTGFLVDKTLGHIIGLVPAAIGKAAEGAFEAFPKWVEAHAGHVVSLEGKPPVTPAFPDFHIDRGTGIVSVLVHDAEQEAMALSEPKAPEREKIEAVAASETPIEHHDHEDI